VSPSSAWLVTAGIVLVLFVQTAVPVGFVPPDTSLLITAAVTGALAGAQTGHLIGRYGRRTLLPRPRTRLGTRRTARRRAVAPVVAGTDLQESLVS
jgi:membrane protein DedA with SNARE-associated domain